MSVQAAKHDTNMADFIGILAYGSLLSDAGEEITRCKKGLIENVKTPFPVEFARSSESRGDAPTLIPVDVGATVRGNIILVDASIEEATNMLYRREIHQVGSLKNYKEPKPEYKNNVRVKALRDFHGIKTVLYTDLSSNIPTVTAETLAQLAIVSVARAETGKDGITYLINAKGFGIRTALSDAYEAEILRMTGAASLDDALSQLREKAGK